MEDPACTVDLDPSWVHCSQDSPLDPLSWIDKTGEPCSMVFPAVFDLYGGHMALEPYFTLLNDCTDLVCLSFCSSTSTSFDDFCFSRDFLWELWQGLMQPFNCHHCQTSCRMSTFLHMQLNIVTWWWIRCPQCIVPLRGKSLRVSCCLTSWAILLSQSSSLSIWIIMWGYSLIRLPMGER